MCQRSAMRFTDMESQSLDQLEVPEASTRNHGREITKNKYENYHINTYVENGSVAKNVYLKMKYDMKL